MTTMADVVTGCDWKMCLVIAVCQGNTQLAMYQRFTEDNLSRIKDGHLLRYCLKTDLNNTMKGPRYILMYFYILSSRLHCRRERDTNKSYSISHHHWYSSNSFLNLNRLFILIYNIYIIFIYINIIYIYIYVNGYRSLLNV